MLRVLHPCPLFFLLSVDNEVASRAQGRRHANSEDPNVLAADSAQLQWEADRWNEIAELASRIRQLLDAKPPPDEETTSYYHVGFRISDWQAPRVIDQKIVPVDIETREVVAKIARDARGQAKRASEYVDEIRPRLALASKQRNPKASRIVKERVAILDALMRAADPAWTTHHHADALMITDRDWTGRDAHGEAIGPPCSGLVRQYLYDPAQPPALLARDKRRKKLIAWIEKQLQRVGS